MTCRDFEPDVVDLARGMEIGAAPAARLRQHLDECAVCAARLAREQQLTVALKAMADAEPPSTRAAVVESNLLAAFDAQRTALTQQRPLPRPTLTRPQVRGSLAAAAAIVLAVAAWQVAARWPASGERAGGVDPDPARGANGPLARPASAADGQVLQFVVLPTAIGLPALESGRIVRVELPAAELPAYGFDVMPQPAGGAVEADVLVGQDGQPRAIRFVTVDTGSRRPQ